jgi:hypothetical protein
MQLEDPVQAMLLSWLNGTGGVGSGMMIQAEPFQCSITARVAAGVVVGCRSVRVELPTAVQSETAGQEMPYRLARK